MSSYEVPDFIVQALYQNGKLTGASYQLYVAGRAFTFVGMAADSLESLADEQANDQKVAEYHDCAGISSARTAIDATASWLRVELSLGKAGPGIDFNKKRYRDKVIQKNPPSRPKSRPLGFWRR